MTLEQSIRRHVVKFLKQIDKEGGAADDEHIIEYISGMLADDDVEEEGVIEVSGGGIARLGKRFHCDAGQVVGSLVPALASLKPSRQGKYVSKLLASVTKEKEQLAEEGKEEAEGKHLEVVLPIPGDLVESSPVDGQGSAAAAVEAAPSYPKEVHSLHDTFPTIPLEVIFRVFNRCNGNGHSAANELLEIDVEEEMEKEKQRLAELEAEKKREEDVLKKRIIARYDEQIDTSDKVYKPQAVFGSEYVSSGELRKGKKREKVRQVRYHEGRVVSTTGEKFITEKLKEEDPNTFVSIRVKSKGKRGPGGLKLSK